MIQKASACIVSLAERWPECVQNMEISQPYHTLLERKTELKDILVDNIGISSHPRLEFSPILACLDRFIGQVFVQ